MKPLDDVTIRRVEASDLEAMQELLSANGFPISIQDLRYRYELYRKAELNRGWAVIDNSQQKMLGYVAVIANKGIRSAKLSARVINLFIAPDYRRQGIGKKLLTVVEEYLASIGCTDVEFIMPQIDPEIAKNFYSTLGYTLSPDRDTYVTTIDNYRAAIDQLTAADLPSTT